MKYQTDYAVQNKIRAPYLGDVALDCEIGARFDRFVYERVNGKFAIDEILREAEICLRDQYDDELVSGKWRGEFWGKLALSAARVCRMKGDDELKENLRKSVYRLLGYQRADGYLSSYADSDNIFPVQDMDRAVREVGWKCPYNWNIWGQKYTLWGLIECAQLLDDPIILNACCRMADHLVGQFRRLGARVKDAGVMHGMAAGSIMKPMLVLYRLTGNREYYEFCLNIAREWNREDGEKPNLVKNGLSGVAPSAWYDSGAGWYTGEAGWYAKAYEMTSCFDGLIELYRVSGDELYLNAAKGYWEALKKNESNILGSVGYCERWADAASYADSATEICDVIHWMRLSYELFTLTGEIKYIEAFEKAYLNAFLAGINADGRGGAFFVRSAGRHLLAEPQVETKYQHCCLNNVGRGFANAAEAAVMQDDEGVLINMYFPTRVRFGKLRIRVSDGYCAGGAISIIVRGADAGDKLRLRIPEWSKKTVITVGETVLEPECGGYACVELPAADTLIQMRFDMTPEVVDFAGEFRDLPADDYHVMRWADSMNGRCDRNQMLRHPMSTVRRGPVLLARSKRLGADEDEMFSGETVFGKDRTCTAQVVRHDRMLCACRVRLDCEDGSREYLMCDYASAANAELEDPRFFTIYV